MTKQDITKTIVTIGVTYKRKGEIVTTEFPVSLQQWIKKTPQEQENYAQQHIGERKMINYDVLR